MKPFLNTLVRMLKDGGAMRDRTADLLRARQALSQLSYSPILRVILKEWWVVQDSNLRPID